MTLTSGLYIHGDDNMNLYGTVINYGTIIGGDGYIDMQGGVLANHGHIDLGGANGYGTFYNTGTLGEYIYLTPTEECNHAEYEDLGTVEATCTHGAGTQFKCNTCYYIGIKETGEPSSHSINSHNGMNICSSCGHTTYDEPANGNGSEEDPYQIANAGNLYWFADKVNNDYDNFKDANAVLTADIVVNDGTFADDGTFTATGATEHSTPIEWLIIARFIIYSHGYRGTFDGQGHTISGLYANYTNSGLVGMSSGECKIKNVGVINSYFASIENVGGICGNADDNTEISNCYSSNVICKGNYVGGILGWAANNDVSIVNCYSTASLIGVEDWAHFGGIAAQSVLTTNCYTTYGNATEWSESEINCEANVSLERFASGEIAYKLNGSIDGAGNWTAGATDGTQAWYQKLGEDGDSYPVLAAAEGNTNTVYYGYENCLSESETYSNDLRYAEMEDAHVWEDGKCTVCKTECEHDWEEYGEHVHKCNICELEADHDWNNGDSKCAVCNYVCQHKVEDDEVWENGECTICGYECKHKDSDNDDYCDICGIHAQTFASLAALIAADQDYDAVNVTIDDEIVVALPHPDPDFSGMYLVALKSDVQLVAPIPEPALNWQRGGRITGTLKYADWGETDQMLSSKDADFWSSLEYTAPAPVDPIVFSSIDELLAADLENVTPVTVTVNGTIAETFYASEMQLYQIVLDNGFTLRALPVASNPGWEAGGTISGTLENVIFIKNGEAAAEEEEEEVGIVSMDRNIFAELTYVVPKVTIGETEIAITLNSEGKYETTENIVLTDGASFTANVEFIAPSITYTRPLASGKWGTLCLPYALSAKDGYEYFTLSNVSNDAVTLSKIEGTVAAGTSVLVRHSDSGNLSLTETDVLVGISTNPAGAIQGLQLQGTFVPTPVTSGYYLDASDNMLHSIDEYCYYYSCTLTIPAFRAWFASPTPAGARSLGMIIDDDEAASLDALRAALDGTALIYGLDGQLRSELRKGVNVVNGKKVIVK